MEYTIGIIVIITLLLLRSPLRKWYFIHRARIQGHITRKKIELIHQIDELSNIDTFR